ncbi:hypothetical protein A45J_2624 [hot springs metagenome]|uniref:TraG N-terminal Proteobacteria domain-containing protein n=1 Tax=hot springs metagenome TaxID=433727 RepID=A0A5J4KZ32_9ZZZZ
MNFDIYTTGGIEFLSQVYKGVIMTFGDSSYETLLRLFGLFSLIFGSIALIGKQQIDYLAKRVAILFLISGFSFGLRADVTIIDTKHDQTYVVSGAPWIPAYVHSLFSAASYQLTNTAQQIFHTGTVNVYEAAATGKNAWASVNLDYNKTGFGGFFEYLNFFKNYRFNTTGITDLDRIYRKFHIALTECTINEIPLWPDNDFQKKIMLSSNLIQDLRPTVNGYVEFEGQPTDCIALYDSAIDDWNTIKSKFDTAGDPTLNLLAKLGITAMDSQKVQEANAEILQQGTMQLSNMIGQAGMVWALSDAWDSFLADQSPERAMVYKYEVGRNIEESKQMGRSLGLYAKETVPLMKIVFESMTIAFIPVTFLIILVSGGNVIRNSIFAFAWVYAWDPVLATINGIVNIAAIAKVKAALNAAAVYNNALNGEWMAYSIQALNIMYSTLDYIPSVAGYLAISTPGIAYMLIKGGEVTMAGIASMMAAPVMSTATHAEAASSLETQKIANQTGKSFGQVEMRYNAAGQAKLNAMVFQSGVDKHGYSALEKSGMGSFEKGVASGLGDKQVMDKFGINTVANAYAGNMSADIGRGGYWSSKGLDAAVQHGADTQFTADKTTDRETKYWNTAQEVKNSAGAGIVDLKTGNVTSAVVHGKSANVQFSEKDAITSSVAESVAAKTDFAKDLMQGKDITQKYGTSEAFTNEVKNTATQKAISDIVHSSEFKESMSDKTIQELFGIMQAGVKTPSISPIQAEGKTGYKISGVTESGKSFETHVQGKEAEAFEKAYQKATGYALKQEMSTTEGLRQAQNISERTGLSTEARKLDQVSREESLSAVTTHDLMPKIVQNVRDAKYKEFAPDVGAGLALNDISKMDEKEFGKWVEKAKEDMYRDFLSGKNDLKQQVDGKIDDAQRLKDENKPILEKVEGNTSGVTGIGHIPINAKSPNENLFNLKKDAGQAEINAGRDGIAPNPFFKAGDAVVDAAGEVIESGKPLPLASPEEQKRRAAAAEVIKQKVDENFKNKN